MTMTKVTPAVRPLTQPTSATCWLTGFQMLFNWKRSKGDTSKNPYDIESLLGESWWLKVDKMKERGILSSEFKEAADMLGLRAVGVYTLENWILANILKMHGPVWIAGQFSKEHAHVVVVTGCDPNGNSVSFVDPWNNYDLSETKQSLEWLNNRSDEWRNSSASIMYFPN